jgi:hypothetical protein
MYLYLQSLLQIKSLFEIDIAYLHQYINPQEKSLTLHLSFKVILKRLPVKGGTKVFNSFIQETTIQVLRVYLSGRALT